MLPGEEDARTHKFVDSIRILIGFYSTERAVFSVHFINKETATAVGSEACENRVSRFRFIFCSVVKWAD